MKPTDFGIGAAVRRKEDPALITGAGRFIDDIQPANCLRAAVVRSPSAHGRFTLEGLDEARAMPGVKMVITADDVAHLGDLPTLWPVENSDGSAIQIPPHPILPTDTVRYVGEAVAMVIAETAAQAQAAAEQVYVDVEEMPVVVDPREAVLSSALLWPQIGTNVAFDADVGDRQATEAAFAEAAHTVELELVNNRVVANYMEPRGAIGEYDDESGRYTLSVTSQGVHLIRPILADNVFNLPQERFRIVTPDVGGAFGTKFFTYREYVLLLFAAEKLRAPVKWISSRLEHFLADYQGRDQVSKAELAVDAQGRFLGLKVDTIANMGAYLSQLATYIPVNGSGMLPGCYRLPAVYARVRGVFTNSISVDAYRGAGRPEAAYLIERLVDKAARELGIAPQELRRRNFVAPEEMPFTTPTGKTYDSGEFAAQMDEALKLADADGFAERAAGSTARGKLRGFGFATYIEACAGGGPEFGAVELAEDGTARIYSGAQTGGQGHATAYAQLASHHLGLPIDKITVIEGDTDQVTRGWGTGGSRSIPVGGSSVARASARLAERIKAKAGERLEAAPGDLELAGGEVRIAGTDRSIPLGEVVAALDEASRRAEEDWQPPAPTFPNGTHVVEVEVDPQTGVVEIDTYTVVDDFGVTLNPMLLEGQVHGGIGQGVGQAMLERTFYDPDSGQLLTASFMDYCLPRADDLPSFAIQTRNVPCATNALGMKGAGEAGAIGACPALVNAVVDALHRAYGIVHVDMPMTPESIWQAIETARRMD